MSFCKVSACRHPESHTTAGHLCGSCHNFGHGRVECDKPILLQILIPYLSEQLPYNSHCTITGCHNKWCHTTQAHHCIICLGNHLTANCPNINSSPTMKIKCPACNCINDVLSDQKLITGLHVECIVCMDHDVQVVLPQCGHINMCLDCAKVLAGVSPIPNILIAPAPIINIINHPNFPLEDVTLNAIMTQLGTRDGKVYTSVSVGMGCGLYIKRDHLHAPLFAYFIHPDDGYLNDVIQQQTNFIAGYSHVI